MLAETTSSTTVQFAGWTRSFRRLSSYPVFVLCRQYIVLCLSPAARTCCSAVRLVTRHANPGGLAHGPLNKTNLEGCGWPLSHRRTNNRIIRHFTAT